MSIPVLAQVYDEVRRLAIAGSVVAAGDFRLKKLVAPLEQSGAKAPVFAKVAEAVKAVVDGPEKQSAQSLLELATLVNAILYTQGETGIAGDLEEIETTELELPSTQTSARVIKPLLDALTETGSGRLEIIRDAHQRDAFRDLRLFTAAVNGIDDHYCEIGDFIAEKILPMYGKAILPILKDKFDIKGRAGHPRRLILMHKMDPEVARDLVKQCLDEGSKEVKVAAIECLGDNPEDLSYLIEQASAKAQEVRRAAFIGLAKVDHADAIAILRKAINPKDINTVTPALHEGKNAKVVNLIVEESRKQLDELSRASEKKEISTKIDNLQKLINCLRGREDASSQAYISELFNQRGSLYKLKGDTSSGSDLVETVVQLMANGSNALKNHLVEAHATLPAEQLGVAFDAARKAIDPARTFEIFSPYITAKVTDRKKQKDVAEKQKMIVETLAERHYFWTWSREKQADLDPRWLDLAVELQNVQLVNSLIRPGHERAHRFLKQTFDTVFQKSKTVDETQDIVTAMVRGEHPEAVECFVKTIEKIGTKAHFYGYWYFRLIPQMPVYAIPLLEALLTKLPEKHADQMIGEIQQLRDKLPKEDPHG